MIISWWNFFISVIIIMWCNLCSSQFFFIIYTYAPVCKIIYIFTNLSVELIYFIILQPLPICLRNPGYPPLWIRCALKVFNVMLDYLGLGPDTRTYNIKNQLVGILVLNIKAVAGPPSWNVHFITQNASSYGFTDIASYWSWLLPQKLNM